MKTYHALASVTLVAAAAAALLTPEPTLAALNDVVTVEVGISAWSPAPAIPSTSGPAPQATDPFAGEPFTPLGGPAPADVPADPDVVVPDPPATPPVEEPSPDPDSSPGSSPGSEPVDTGSSTDAEIEPTAAPDPGATASPAEETPSATDTTGEAAADGGASSSALTSDG